MDQIEGTIFGRVAPEPWREKAPNLSNDKVLIEKQHLLELRIAEMKCGTFSFRSGRLFYFWKLSIICQIESVIWIHTLRCKKTNVIISFTTKEIERSSPVPEHQLFLDPNARTLMTNVAYKLDFKSRSLNWSKNSVDVYISEKANFRTKKTTRNDRKCINLTTLSMREIVHHQLQTEDRTVCAKNYEKENNLKTIEADELLEICNTSLTWDNCLWAMEDAELFSEVPGQFQTDLKLINGFCPNRNQRQMKNKFIKERDANSLAIVEASSTCTSSLKQFMETIASLQRDKKLIMQRKKLKKI